VALLVLSWNSTPLTQMTKEEALVKEIQAKIRACWAEKDKIEAIPKPSNSSLNRVHQINGDINSLRWVLERMKTLDMIDFNPLKWD
jgi:5,10-methylenetetrahydrofolate reductase